jgi:hypothetical protein
LFNSSFFEIPVSPWREVGHAAAALMVVVGSVLHLSKIPFVNHHQRRWMTSLRFGMHGFLTATPIVFVLSWSILGAPELVYDYVFFCLLAYLFVSWTQISRVDLGRIRQYVAGGPLVLPIVHVESSWRSSTFCDYFYVTEVSGEASGDGVRSAEDQIHPHEGAERENESPTVA